MNQDPGYGQYMPPPGQPRKTHRFRNWVVVPVAGLIGLIVVVAVIAGLAGSRPEAVKTPVVTPVTAPASSQPAATQPAAAVPSPDGTFQGSCNYDLGSDPAGGTATATGDIDAANTGNVGIVVRLTITWPQEGFAPLKLTRTIRLPKGGEQDVQFHRPLSYDQISRLQDYQTGHGFKDGCTYNGEMTSTFGQAG